MVLCSDRFLQHRETGVERKVIIGIAVAALLIMTPLSYLVLNNDGGDETERWAVGYYLEYTETVYDVVVVDWNSTFTPWIVSFRERWEVTEVNGDDATFHHQMWTYDPIPNGTLIRYSSENLTLPSERPFEPLHMWVVDHVNVSSEAYVLGQAWGNVLSRTYAVQEPIFEEWAFAHGTLILHWTSERIPGDSAGNYTEVKRVTWLTDTNLPWLLNDIDEANEGS